MATFYAAINKIILSGGKKQVQEIVFVGCDCCILIVLSAVQWLSYIGGSVTQSIVGYELLRSHAKEKLNILEQQNFILCPSHAIQDQNTEK